MFDVITAKPSQWRKVQNKEIPTQDVLNGVKEMIVRYNGANDSWSDDVYVASIEVSNSGIYDLIDRKDLFEILMMDSTAVPWFIEGLPKELQQEFKQYTSDDD